MLVAFLVKECSPLYSLLSIVCALLRQGHNAHRAYSAQSLARMKSDPAQCLCPALLLLMKTVLHVTQILQSVLHSKNLTRYLVVFNFASFDEDCAGHHAHSAEPLAKDCFLLPFHLVPLGIL